MLLNGWKEISKHLGRGIRTVQRWEKLGLPLRRPNRKKRSAVVALSKEVDEWVKAGPHTQPAALPAGKKQATTGPFKRRILIADDDEALLVTIAALLDEQGYDVRTARDGFEALAALRIGLPDVLISDLRMPNMSGFELLAVVRKRFPSIGVIAFSSEFTPAVEPAIIADAYVQKGVNSGFELMEAVRELLTRVPLRSQPAKPDTAPAWIPRSTNGYVVLTCPDCLRSFSVATRQLAIDEAGREKCVHCGQQVHYRIDKSVLPIAAEFPTLLDRAQRSLDMSRAMIKQSRTTIRQSHQVPEQGNRASQKKTAGK